MIRRKEAKDGRARFAAPVAAALLALAPLAPPQAAEHGAAATNLPAPGTYVLQKIQRVPDATLLDEAAAPVKISAYTRGAVTALGFFYGHCADPTGCPVAWSVFEAAREAARRDPLLASRLRLVFVSLDPARDTPSTLRLLKSNENGDDGHAPWSFLTGASEREVTPLLRAMGQDVAYEIDDSGRRSGAINHMLKVFLIDPDGWVREIYSTAFLTPESLLNDARTLARAFPNASSRLVEP
ncbi:SCO family protein [Methylocystis echinoides]|uniref:SCO family protein n=1 Tax=Methylocystis echinoides TaxID=29468 RepID=UPI0034151E6D